MQDDDLELTDPEAPRDPAATGPAPRLVQTGRWQVLGVVLVATLIALYIVVERFRLGGADRLPRAGVRFLLTVGLMYAVWRGQRWAKWTFIMFSVPLGVAALVVALSGARGPNLLALGSFYLGAGLTLVASRSANAFLASQRGDDLSCVRPAQFVLMKGYIVVLLALLSFLFTVVLAITCRLEGAAATTAGVSGFALLGLGFWIGTAVVAREKGYALWLGIVFGAFAPLGLLILTVLPNRS